jgi:uncharacterized protein (UPF0335 family)
MNTNELAEQLQEWYIEALSSGFSVNKIWVHVAKRLEEFSQKEPNNLFDR